MAANAIPLDVSGSIGYNYRSLEDPQDNKTVSNQFIGSLNLGSYIWRPWLATTQLGINATFDDTDYDNGSSNTESDIITGEFLLNVLPQSKAPFQLSYRISDSRVENFTTDSPLVTFKNEFETRRFEVKQSYITDAGHRFMARYENNRWDSSRSGNFDDDKIGLEADVRLSKHHFIGKANYQTIEQSSDIQPQVISERESKNMFFNVDHFWFPTEAIRVDSFIDYYKADETIDLPPLGSNRLENSDTDLGQFSSSVFWRPEDRPLTMSGSIRLYRLETSSTAGNFSNDLKNMNISASGGSIYQFTKNLRFDGNIGVTGSESEDNKSLSTQLRGGLLYQSDIVDLKGFNYQWFSNLNASNQTGDNQNIQRAALTLSHNGQRSWITGDNSLFSVSLSQSLSEDYQSEEIDESNFLHRLTHSGFATWNHSAWSGTTTLRLTLSDTRDISDSDNQQQMVNFQATRNQEINRRSSLTGDLTVQTIKQSYQGQVGDDTVTTATGRLNFSYRQLFGVPQLQYLSDFFISRASRDDNVDRGEWENRLSYRIGQLDASASLRLINEDGERFDLIYVQVARRF